MSLFNKYIESQLNEFGEYNSLPDSTVQLMVKQIEDIMMDFARSERLRQKEIDELFRRVARFLGANYGGMR